MFVHEANSAGHLAAILVRRLFPELFGSANLRFSYNWYGGWLRKKQKLDPVHAGVVKAYVCRFHPEVKSEDAWNCSVVPKVNELLRRMEKNRTSVVMQLPSPETQQTLTAVLLPPTSTIQMPPMSCVYSTPSVMGW